MRVMFACLFTLSILNACDRNAPVEALGTLERDRIVLKSTANEIIISEPIKEGRLVKKGSLLVQLDDRRQKAKVAGAEAELARAIAKLEELRNGAREEDVDAAKAKVDGARANLVVTEKSYQRAVQLVKQDLMSQAVFDKTLANRDSAEAALESATKALLRLTNGTRQEELDQGEAMRNAAQAQLDLEVIVLSELSVRATRDAYLDSLPWNEGERVTAGTTIAVLLAGDKPYARVYVPEPWRAKLKPGMELIVTVDGVDKALKGRLRWIATEPSFTPYYALNEQDRSRLVYVAEVDLLEGKDLPSGVPAQVQLPRQ